jgi:hypothetical protein
MGILDILFKLALIVTMTLFYGMAWAANRERRKYFKASTHMASFLEHARTHLFNTVEATLDGWLRHDANCPIHNRPASGLCTCGLYDAMMALKKLIDDNAATPR